MRNDIHYSLTDSTKQVGAASEDLRALRRSRTTAATKARASDKAMLHTAPPTPRARVSGTPIAIEIQLETETAVKTKRGDSMDRKTIAGPKNALPNTDANATIGSKYATSEYWPEYSMRKAGPLNTSSTTQYGIAQKTQSKVIRLRTTLTPAPPLSLRTRAE